MKIASTLTARRDRKGGIKRTLLIVLIVLVVLILAGVLAAPALLSGAVAGIIERSVNDGIEGRVQVEGVSLSWGGPQQIRSLVLEDPAGSTVATLNASLESGLLPIVFGSRDLGLIRLRGDIDVRQQPDGSLNVTEALAPKPEGPVVVTPRQPAPTTPPAPSEPIRVPEGLALEIDASGINLTYTPLNPAIGPVGFKTVQGTGRFATGQPVKLDIEARTLDGRDALRIVFNADRLTTDEGLLALRGSEMTLDINGSLPPDYADALGRIIAPEGSGNATVGPAPDGGFSIKASIAARDGRLALTNNTGPAIIRGRIPASVLSLASAGNARVHIDTPPRVEAAIYQLDLPLPETGSLFDADWRDAIIVAAVATEAISGTVALENQPPKAFSVEPVELRLQPLDRLFDLVMNATIRATYDDTEAGAIDLDFRMAGLLNPEGRPKLGEFAPRGDGYTLVPGPEYLRAQLRTTDFPTALLQPWAARAGLSLADVMGETVAILARAGVRQGTSDLPTEVTMGEGETVELPPVGQPYLAITLESALTTAWIDLYLDANRILTRNKGIKVESDAIGRLIRELMPQYASAIEGEGKGFIQLTDVNIPLIPGAGPDLQSAAGNYRIIVGRLDLNTGPDTPTLTLDSFDFETTLRPGSSPTWGLDARALYEGEKFALVGRGELLGVFAPNDDASAPLGLSPATIRPTGTLNIMELPTRVASLVSARAGAIAEAAAGRQLKGTIESTRLGDTGIRVTTTLEGDAAVAQGGLSLDDGRVSFDDKGLIVTLFQPGRLLSALADAGAAQPPLTFDNAGQATLTISDTSIDLDELAAGARLTGVGANARLSAQGLTGRVSTEGRSAQLSIDSVNAGLSLDRSGDLAITLDSAGRVDGAPTTSSGTLRIADAIAQDGSLSLAGARFEGSWQARNLPTSLLAVVSPEQAAIARQTIGDTIDLSLTPENGAEADRGAWRVAAIGASGFEMVSRLALGESELRVGPTRVSAPLTPPGVDAALAAYAPDLSPRPRLAHDAPLDLTADAFGVPLSEGYKPDLSGGLRLTGRLASPGDIVLTDLPGLEPGSSLGLRDLTLSAQPSGNATQFTLEPTTLFDPASNQTAATLSGSATYPADPLSATLRAAASDASAVDAMLATDGLIRQLVGDSITVELLAIAPTGGGSAPIEASVQSPRLQASASMTRTDRAITLTKPASVDWRVSKEAAERLLFAREPGSEAPMTVENDVRLRLDVPELNLGAGDTGPLAQGVFRLGANVRLDPVTFVSPKTGERAVLPASAGRISTDPATGAIIFDIDEQRSARPAEGDDITALLAIDAKLENYADASGAPAFDRAHITSTIRGHLPTALVDALASMNGMLEAIAGPTLATTITTDDLSRADATGSIAAEIDAPYADFTLTGQLQTGPDGPILASTKPMEARVFRITNETSERILGVVFPLLTRFEKTRNDDPAVVTATGLTLPLDGRTESLNGTFLVTPGTVQFDTKAFFAKLLSATSNRTTGSLGGKLQPFEVVVQRGVANYKKAVIPAGEFDIETYGTVDLNKRTMDVYALVPLYAVQNDLAAAAKRVPGVGELTRIPLRSKGSFGNPEIGIDFEELVRRVPQNLGNGVGDILDRTLGDLLRGKDKDKKNEDKKKNEQKTDSPNAD